MHKIRQGVFLIAKIHTIMDRISTKILKKNGLGVINPGQGRILFALWQEQGISLSELSRKTALEKSTLTSMMDRLEGTGFIARVPSRNDRRVTLIRLTPKVKRLQETYMQITREKRDLVYSGFTPKEMDLFEGYLERILENLVAAEDA